jgi:hypothetical protein
VSSPEREVARAKDPDESDGSDDALRLVHHHPGYLRIRAAAFVEPEDDSPVVAAARTAAETAAGFRSWTHNPLTGSVVIQYDPATLDADELLKHIARSASFPGVEVVAGSKMNREELVSTFLDTVQGVNQVVSHLTGDRADLREVVPAALAATSVVSFLLNKDRGRLPNWSSALYHSYRVFMQWHRREVRTRERIGRQKEESAGAGSKNTKPR